MNERETKARYEVFLEQYLMTVELEARTLLRMGRTMIFPTAVGYATELHEATAAIGIGNSTGKTVAALAGTLQTDMDALAGMVDHIHDAAFARDTVLPKMLEVRAAVDSLELLLPDDMWALPSYQEMLFIK